MGTLQTLIGLVVLIYVLCVIVQFVQEVAKKFLDTKATTMEKVICKFMGEQFLKPDQIKAELEKRGLDSLAALEHFNKQDFRNLIDAIPFTPEQATLLTNAQTSIQQFRDHAEATYDAAIAKFQRVYEKNNKIIAAVISLVVVLGLNANIFKIYEQLSADQIMSQAIAGTAATLLSSNKPENQTSNQPNTGSQGAGTGTQAGGTHPGVNPGATQTTGTTPTGTTAQQIAPQAGTAATPSETEQTVADIYNKNRAEIQKKLQEYPILVRWDSWSDDYEGANWSRFLYTALGLPIMILLVSLGAPFWNDVLKGMTGVNNALNTTPKKSP